VRTRAGNGGGSATGAYSEGAVLTGVLGGARGPASRVEVICSNLVARSEIKYLLPRARIATLTRYVAKSGRQLPVMLAIGHDGPLRILP
jgi:hypothetical protein